MSSVVNKTKAEKKQPDYNDIVNIKLPTHPKADKSDLLQPVKLSRDDEPQQPNPRMAYRLEKSYETTIKEKTAVKAHKRLNTSRIHQEKEQDKREEKSKEKDPKLKSIIKPLQESKYAKMTAKEKLEVLEKADPTTPK